MNLIISPETDTRALYRNLAEGHIDQVLKALGEDPQGVEAQALLGLALANKRDFRRADAFLESLAVEGDWAAGVVLEAQILMLATQRKRPEDLK
jgi:thioredoxin-like negative regulator of GroEL